ncbi:MAG: hypothetical protein VW475_14165, partial [Curvibacter sp.]
MNPAPRQPLAFFRRLLGSGDALAGHREKILLRIAVVSAALLAPFGINNLFIDRVPLGIAILATVAVLVVDAVAIHRRRKPPVPFELLLVPVAIAVALLLRTQPLYGVLWTYPAILFSYFVLSRPMAIPVSLGLLACTTGMVYASVDGGTAVRVFASVLLTIVIVISILGVVNVL